MRERNLMADCLSYVVLNETYENIERQSEYFEEHRREKFYVDYFRVYCRSKERSVA